MKADEITVKKISNGYLLNYYIDFGWEERYFETKQELFDFIDQTME